jgi:RNA polymerase sigma-70 factor (ECF subfamily)
MSEVFERHRSRLFNVAYGMLGSFMDAEDVVQDAYLRWRDVDDASVDAPVAYLTTITTRLAIDRLRSAQHRRETYVGPWLPDPMVTDFAADPAEVVVGADQMRLALLTAMERLNPIERAVLLLRDVFDSEYAEIADIVDKSPANVRQIAVRARERVGDTSRRSGSDQETDARLVAEYMTAIASGNVDEVARVFSEDVVLWSDGGGKARAARHPLHGATRVARHLVGVSPQAPEGMQVAVVRVNGDPAIEASVGDSVIALIAFEVADGSIIGVRAQLNPDKLAHLTPHA